MKDWHNIGTGIAIIAFLIGSLLQYFGLGNQNIIFCIYFIGIIFLFIQPIIEVGLYFQNKHKESETP